MRRFHFQVLWFGPVFVFCGVCPVCKFLNARASRDVTRAPRASMRPRRLALVLLFYECRTDTWRPLLITMTQPPRKKRRRAVVEVEEYADSDALRQVHTTPSAVLSADQCHDTVQAAETHAAARGWSKGRHAAYPTQDLPVYALGTAGSVVAQAVEAVLLPELAQRFGLKRELLLIQDLFVAKCERRRGNCPTAAVPYATLRYPLDCRFCGERWTASFGATR
jgi:hypothetical protein